MDNNCIMPECPYCPTCEYGYVLYKDEDYDGYEEPTDCEWICRRGVKDDSKLHLCRS